MDVIALAQAGIGEAVAPLGTALTEDQLSLLWRMNSEPILCFDGDQAGLRAANRVVDLALPVLKPGQSLHFALLEEGKDPDDLVRAEGAQGFRAVLDDAKPLADMLWMRETMGGSFDTPERRAELESRLREITQKIANEDIRRHYGQEMRDRAQQFFGRGRKFSGWNKNNGGNAKGKQYGQYGQRGGLSSGRLTISDSLARSTLVKGGRSGSGSVAPPLRETAILMTLINHPRLVEEDFEAMAALDLEHEQLRNLHLAMLDVLALSHVEDGIEMHQAMTKAGYGEQLAQMDQIVRRARLWPATTRAAEDDAREALKQALHLHQRARTLHKELRAVEAALANDETGEVFGRLLEIQNEIRKADATEALIEGFGLSSGRPAGGF